MRFKYVRYSSEHEFLENNASEDWFTRTFTYKLYVRTESELEPCNMKSAGCYIFYQCTGYCVDYENKLKEMENNNSWHLIDILLRMN